LAGGGFTATAQWTNQTVPFGFEGYLNDIEVVDGNTVWGNPWDGLATTPYTQAFVRTIDGGNTWSVGNIVGSPANHNISNIWPIDGNTCYVSMWINGAAGGKVYKTTNGGNTWNQVGANMFSFGTSFANIVYFYDAQHGIAGGDPVGSPLKYELYTTSDSGATWIQVPPASLPALTNAAEYGITNLFSAVQGHFWFATTYGDVYHTPDMGVTWTKSASGFAPYTTTNGRQDISDISFTDSLNGLIVQTTTTGFELRRTTDGGMTWSVVTPGGGGVFYPQEIEGVPGTTTYVSCGSNGTFGFGSSFSNDNGLTWTDLDNGLSHTSADFSDLSTGWSGEYILAGNPGGVWKFTGVLQAVACGSPLISHGTGSANDSLICWGDTLVFTTTGVQAPTVGTTHGFSVIVSSGDISFNNDPLNQPGILGGTGVIIGTPPPTQLIHDGTVFPAGLYYFTPVVYGNAVGTGNITALTLDTSCTYTGASVLINLLVQGDPYCAVGIPENPVAGGSLEAYFNDRGGMQVHLLSDDVRKASVTLVDLAGRVVTADEVTLVPGTNDFTLAVPALDKGVYLVRVSAGFDAVRKIVRY